MSHQCCGNGSMIGAHFIVEKMTKTILPCRFCGAKLDTIAVDGFSLGRARIEILKKIPPLSELDKIETKEDLPCKV